MAYVDVRARLLDHRIQRYRHTESSDHLSARRRLLIKFNQTKYTLTAYTWLIASDAITADINFREASSQFNGRQL